MASAKLLLLTALGLAAATSASAQSPGYDGGAYMRQVRERPTRAERPQPRRERAAEAPRRGPAAPCRADGGDLIGAIAGGLAGSGGGPARDRPAGRRC